jgi:hypothetical protein
MIASTAPTSASATCGVLSGIVRKPRLNGSPHDSETPWSLEVVEYDQAGNNDERNDNSRYDRASDLSVVSGFSFSGGKPRMPWLVFFASVWRE